MKNKTDKSPALRCKAMVRQFKLPLTCLFIWAVSKNNEEEFENYEIARGQPRIVRIALELFFWGILAFAGTPFFA